MEQANTSTMGYSIDDIKDDKLLRDIVRGGSRGGEKGDSLSLPPIGKIGNFCTIFLSPQ